MAEHSVPFKGSLDALIIATSGPPAAVEITAVATGNATHMGLTTAVIDYVFHNPQGTFAGTAVFTRANGDTLNLSFAGQELSDGSLEGSLMFQGGTGRFTDASGGGDFSGIDHFDGTFSFSLDATISY
jgi:hypothetical protein